MTEAHRETAAVAPLWLPLAVLLSISAGSSAAQILATPPKLGEQVQRFVRFDTGRYALTHV